MDDFIDNETPATSASTIERVFCPKEDGVFSITVRAEAAANEKAPPAMWVNISVNDGTTETVIKKGQHVAWQNGPAATTLVALYAAKKGGLYTVHAVAPNENADAKGIAMSIQRVH